MNKESHSMIEILPPHSGHGLFMYLKPLTRTYSIHELHGLIDKVLSDTGIGSLSNSTQDALSHYLKSERPSNSNPSLFKDARKIKPHDK